MRYLFNIVKKNKDYLIIFIIAFFLSVPYVIDICSGYLDHYNFDLQEFLLWHYASINNLFPYKDIFYPYGLLNYFKNYNLLSASVYYLISPILFTFVYFILQKVFKDKFILYSSFAIFYLFILVFVGFQTFSRYGLLVVLSLYFSHIFYSAKKIKIGTLIYSGVILGLFFTFVTDQGIYLIFSFIFMYLFSRYLQVKEHLLSVKFSLKTIKEMLYVVLGFFIGITPLFLFLLKNSNLDVLLNYFRDVMEIVTVAKTPFFSFIDSPANIFTIVILYFAIFYNFLKICFLKNKFSLSSFLQVSLIFSILIMEYKSMIRSIDRQIVFVSLILLMLLVYEIVNYFKSNIVNKRVIYILLVFVITVLYSFNVDNQIINFPHLSKNLNLLLSNKCFDNNLNYFSVNNPSYIEIINFIKKQNNFSGKIFSFPTGDSAFYVLLNQKPPFYNAIFEGASYDKQNSVIHYIQDNRIEFVTLNTSKSSLQDGVPDYIRQNLLFKYILNNYYPFKVIGNHIILKKEKNSDFFASKILNQAKDYGSYLLDVYLHKIPFSEGLYKYKYLEKNNKLITESTDINIINIFLKKRIFYSDNRVIVMIPSENNKSLDLNFIKFHLKNGDSTTVYYNSCKANTQCIINFSKAPLFYKKRMIAKIILDKKFKGKIEIFDANNLGKLW